MTQREFLAAHVAAFAFFDGCPHRLVPDNLGSGVLRPDLYDPRLNRGYAELSHYYGCLVDPARVAHPKDKACASDCSWFEVSGTKSSHSCGALLLERLLEKGKVVYKKAYADWSRYNDYKRPFHEAAIELVDIPQRNYSGKNSADIRMVVDAMDLCYSKGHITTFVIASGDSDFSPLVSKLKENDKSVLGIGVKNSSSDLLVSNCDEFIFYEDLVRGLPRGMPSVDSLPEKKREVFRLLIDSIQALKRENKDVIWGSMVKQTMQRKKPYFNESYYGFDSFSSLLEEAQKLAIVSLKKDTKSGGYVLNA